MKLPNVLSTAVILAIAAFLEYIATGAESIFPSIWVPIAVLLLTGVAKGLQVYAENAKTNGEIRAAAERKRNGLLRRTMLD